MLFLSGASCDPARLPVGAFSFKNDEIEEMEEMMKIKEHIDIPVDQIKRATFTKKPRFSHTKKPILGAGFQMFAHFAVHSADKTTERQDARKRINTFSPCHTVGFAPPAGEGTLQQRRRAHASHSPRHL